VNEFDRRIFVALACIGLGLAATVVRLVRDTPTTRGAAAIVSMVLAAVGLALVVRARVLESRRVHRA